MARIRTLKPEFWSHPILGRQDDMTKNLAVALLNLADDEGYFPADPILVRNFCRPFDEDSLNVHGALTALSNIGWISVSKSKDHGLIGKVVNFSVHQRINRPTPSKLKRYFDSLSPHTYLTEDSHPEGNREQGTGKGTGKRNTATSQSSVRPAGALSVEVVSKNDPLLRPFLDSFLSKGNFSDYAKETKVAKDILVKIHNLAPEETAAAAQQILETFLTLTQGSDTFWAGQPFTPCGLSPVLDRVWAQARKATQAQDLSWLDELAEAAPDLFGGKA